MAIEQPYSVDLDALRKKAEQIQEREEGGSGDNDLQFHNLENGSTVLRVLPPWSSRGAFYLEVYRHYLPDTRHICIQKTFPDQGKPCPICFAIRHLADKGREEEMDGLWPSYKAYVNAILRGKEDKGVFITGLPRTVMDAIVLWSNNPEIGALVDVNSGLDIIVTRSGQGRTGTKYNSTTSPKGRSPLHPDDAVANDLLSKMYNLDDIWKFPNEEILGTIYQDASALLVKYAESQEILTPLRESLGLNGRPAVSSPPTPPPAPSVTPPPPPPPPTESSPSPVPETVSSKTQETETGSQGLDGLNLSDFSESNRDLVAQRTIKEPKMIHNEIEGSPRCIGHHQVISGLNSGFCSACVWETICTSQG